MTQLRFGVLQDELPFIPSYFFNQSKFPSIIKAINLISPNFTVKTLFGWVDDVF